MLINHPTDGGTRGLTLRVYLLGQNKKTNKIKFNFFLNILLLLFFWPTNLLSGLSNTVIVLVELMQHVTVHNMIIGWGYRCLSFTGFVFNLVFVNVSVKICENAFSTQQIMVTVTFTVR